MQKHRLGKKILQMFITKKIDFCVKNNSYVRQELLLWLEWNSKFLIQECSAQNDRNWLNLIWTLWILIEYI